MAALAISFTLRVAGTEGLAEILRRIGVERAEQVVNQSDLWISYDETRAATDAAADICREPDIGYRLGEEAARVLEEQGRLNAFRNREFSEIIEVLTTVLRNGNSVRRMQELELQGETARLEAVALSHPDDRFLCRFVVGFTTAVPAYIGRIGMAVETACVADGAARCRYLIDWRPGPAAQSALTLIDSTPATSEGDGVEARPDESPDVSGVLETIVRGLAIPHHVLGVEAVVMVGGRTLTHRRGSLEVQDATVFSAGITNAPGVTGTISLAFAGRGLPAIDRHLVSWCAEQIGLAIDQASALSSLRNRATLDPLTGLANRALLVERASDLQDGGAVVFIDLDRFKEVNDGLGHTVGDSLLTEIGARLRAKVRSSDLVARYGGDEFVALLGGTSSMEDACAVAEKLSDAFGDPVIIDGNAVTIAGSWGVARCPDDGTRFEELIAVADERMYRTKPGARATPA